MTWRGPKGPARAGSPPSGPAVAEDGETESERLNRNLDQLLQELRVALPGVQVLFAFLLVVPFNARFTELDAPQRDLYLVALLAAAAASALLIAPSAHHRVLFHRRRKPQLVRLASALALAGMGLLVVAFTAAVALVASFVFSTPVAVITAGATAAIFTITWFVVPLWLRERPRDPAPPGP